MKKQNQQLDTNLVANKQAMSRQTWNFGSSFIIDIFMKTIYNYENETEEGLSINKFMIPLFAHNT
jgi:hypothetical protein